MHKFIALIPRRADRTQAFFQHHYETRHAPLAIAQLEHFRFQKYVRNHLVSLLAGTRPDFDVISEFWYAQLSDLAVVGAFLASPAAQHIHDDEDHFMDQPKVISSEVREHLVAGDARGFDAQPVAKLSIGLHRMSAVAADDFITATRAAATELVAQPGALRVTVDEPIAGNTSAKLPWDAFVQVWLNRSLAADCVLPPALLRNTSNYFVAAAEGCESALPA